MASKGLSEASSSGPKSKYEVFLSFRGEDTRKNFTDHLYSALISAGVNTFRDDDELPRGKHISSELLTAIQDSKISIVVFSKGYASSKWCLNELVKIIECKSTTGLIVVPIFYDVDPSDVRKQTGSYAEAFARHEEQFKADMKMIQSWRTALSVAADLSGWDLQNIANGHESKFIQKVVDDVLRKVNRVYLHVSTHPVDMECRIKMVMGKLSMGCDEVRIVGIYGMGGIGKTTIAKAVYNSVSDKFEGSSFLSDVKDIFKQPNGPASILEQLLCDILNRKRIRITNFDRGVNMIQERLCCRRVFIVFDDVDNSTESTQILKSLVGDRNWLGAGSRIIITTRDEHVLTELEVDERYKVQPLNLEESIQLFSWHAFRRPYPKNDYSQLSMDVVDHAQGHPLALVVLGSYLFKRSQTEWESAIEKLRQIPHDHIYKKLRISFDTLDDYEQAIFLDIACFFNRMHKVYVMKILDGCGFFPVIGVRVLLERSLITIGQFFDHNLIKMHDLLQDMGREIVRELSPNHIGKRSRLWFHQDVVNVLRKNMGSEAVEGLSLDLLDREDATVSTEAFAKMINLRLLKINSVRFNTGCYENFSKEIRWLCWHRCPLQVLPPDLHLDNLVVLDLQFSNVKRVWKETKILYKLKILDLSYSMYLVETPNFAGLRNLERLGFQGCTSLVKVHQSIGQLKRLVFLNLAECKNLRELPDSICDTRSLHTLNLNGCSKLHRLPEHLGELEGLNTLLADACSITQLPCSLGRLKNLECLSLAGCKDVLPSNSWLSFFSSLLSPKSASCSTLLPGMFSQLSSLKQLNLSHRNLSESDISIDFGSFQFLLSLNLGGNKFYSLPVGISNHPRLQELYLNDCTNLQSIPGLPPNLDSFEAQGCTSVDRYPNLFNIGAMMSVLKVTNCHKTVDIWDLHHRHLSTPSKASSWFGFLDSKGFFMSYQRYFEACIPCREVPDWFDYKNPTGSSVLFRVPSLNSLSTGETRAMIVCIVYSIKHDQTDRSHSDSLTIHFRNKSKGYESFDVPDRYYFDTNIREDHSWICYMAEETNDGVMEEGDEMEVVAEAFGRIVVKKLGFHLPDHYPRQQRMHKPGQGMCTPGALGGVLAPGETASGTMNFIPSKSNYYLGRISTNLA